MHFFQLITNEKCWLSRDIIHDCIELKSVLDKLCLIPYAQKFFFIKNIALNLTSISIKTFTHTVKRQVEAKSSVLARPGIQAGCKLFVLIHIRPQIEAGSRALAGSRIKARSPNWHITPLPCK